MTQYVAKSDLFANWEVGETVFYPTIKFDSQKELMQHLTDYDAFCVPTLHKNAAQAYVLTRCFIHEIVTIPEEMLLDLDDEDEDELMCILEPMMRDENRSSEDMWVGGYDMLAQVYQDTYYASNENIMKEDLLTYRYDVMRLYHQALRQAKKTATFESLYLNDELFEHAKDNNMIKFLETYRTLVSEKEALKALMEVEQMTRVVERSLEFA